MITLFDSAYSVLVFEINESSSALLFIFNLQLVQVFGYNAYKKSWLDDLYREKGTGYDDRLFLLILSDREHYAYYKFVTITWIILFVGKHPL